VQSRQSLDRGLLSQKSRELFARFLKYPGITNYFLTDNSWTGTTSPWIGRVCSVYRGPTLAWTMGTAARSPELGLRPLRCAKAHRRGRNGERSTRGTRRAAHRGTRGGVAAGHRQCKIEGGGAQWKLRSSTERRVERAGEVRSDPGVVLAFYRGWGGGLGVEMPVSNDR
jgi:hypothetical protein